jgi:outer membrane protein
MTRNAMKLIRVTILLLLALNAERAGSQTTPVPMTLAECLATAYERNAGLRAARAGLVAAEAKADESFTSLLPQLKFSGRVAQLSEVDPFSITLPGIGTQTIFPSIPHSYAARLTLQQPLFNGFRLRNQWNVARLNAAATHEDLARQEVGLAVDVTTAYWNLHRAMEVEKVVAQTVEQVSEHLRDVRNFYAQGLATQNDVYKVEVQLADVKVKMIEARSGHRLAAMALNNLLGAPLETPVVPADEPDANKETIAHEELTTLLARARANRPELKGMAHRLAVGEHGVDLARGGWYPTVALVAGYDYARPNPRVIPPRDRWEGTWDVGVTLQWNVWDWFNTAHQTTQAEATLRETEATFAQLESAVALQVAHYHAKVFEAREKQDVVRKGVEQAQEGFRIAREQFKQGLTTNTDLLDAELALMQARLSQTQAQIEYQIAVANLKQAVGAPR